MFLHQSCVWRLDLRYAQNYLSTQARFTNVEWFWERLRGRSADSADSNPSYPGRSDERLATADWAVDLTCRTGRLI